MEIRIQESKESERNEIGKQLVAATVFIQRVSGEKKKRSHFVYSDYMAVRKTLYMREITETTQCRRIICRLVRAGYKKSKTFVINLCETIQKFKIQSTAYFYERSNLKTK